MFRRLSDDPNKRPWDQGGSVPAAQQPAGPRPPQWYPDPEQPGTLRYWDGSRWTSQRAPMPSPAPMTDHGNVESIGYVTAILFPIVGFVVGCVLVGKSNAAGTIIGLSLAAAACWFFLFVWM